MRPRRFLVPAVLLAAALLAPPAARAQQAVIDIPHTVQTILHLAGRVYEIAQKAQQIYNQYEQLRLQVEALRRLDIRSWRDIGPYLTEVDRIFGSADNLAYSLGSAASVWNETFPLQSYEEPLADRLKAARRSLHTLRAGVEALSRMQRHWYDSRLELATLKGQAEAASTPQQIAETQATLLAHQAESIESLRPTLAVLTNLTAAGFAEPISRAQREEATYQTLLNKARFRTAGALSSSVGYDAPSVLPPFYPR